MDRHTVIAEVQDGFDKLLATVQGLDERAMTDEPEILAFFHAVADRIDYVTTKTAILGMTRAVAIETTRSGITCNALCPGTLPTPAIQGKIASIAAADSSTVEEATRDYLATRQPTGRFVAMEAVGAMAAFLCSPAAQDITGATLPIDGGWSVA